MAGAPECNRITKDVTDMLFGNIKDYVDRIKRNSERLVNALKSRGFKEYVETRKDSLENSLNQILLLSNRTLYECLVSLRQFIQDNEALISISNIFTVRSLELILDDGVKILDDQEKSENDIAKFLIDIAEGRTCSSTPCAEQSEPTLNEFLKDKPPNIAQRIMKDFQLAERDRKERFRSSLKDLIKEFEPLKALLCEAHDKIEVGRGGVNAAAAGNGGGVALLGGLLGGPLVAITAGFVAFEAGKRFGDRLVDAEIERRAGTRFLRRQSRSWYAEIEAKIIAYLSSGESSSGMSNDELRRLIAEEELEPDLEHFRRCLERWLAKCRDDIRSFRVPDVDPETVRKQVDQSWAFIEAVVGRCVCRCALKSTSKQSGKSLSQSHLGRLTRSELLQYCIEYRLLCRQVCDDNKLAQRHDEALQGMINAALAAFRRTSLAGVAGSDLMPLLSVGWISADSDRLELKFIIDTVDPSALEEVAKIVRKAVGEGTTCKGDPPLLSADRRTAELVFRLHLGKSDTAGRLAAVLLRCATDLSRSHVAAVLLGNYDVSSCPKVLPKQ